MYIQQPCWRIHARGSKLRYTLVTVGRIRRCPVHDIRLVALVNNTVRGAAGAAILNAELMLRRGLIGRRSTVARMVS